MPDENGYEIQPQHRRTLLHHPCDQQVTNTPRGRREHLATCRRGQAARDRAEQAARDHERGVLAALDDQLTIDPEGGDDTP